MVIWSIFYCLIDFYCYSIDFYCDFIDSYSCFMGFHCSFIDFILSVRWFLLLVHWFYCYFIDFIVTSLFSIVIQLIFIVTSLCFIAVSWIWYSFLCPRKLRPFCGRVRAPSKKMHFSLRKRRLAKTGFAEALRKLFLEPSNGSLFLYKDEHCC